mgnify:CR=1 FL=1
MNQPRSSCDVLPLFHAELDVWESLDEPTQEQVLDYLGLLLLRHLPRIAGWTSEHNSVAKGPPT